MSAVARIRRGWWGIRHELSWGFHHVTSGRVAYLVNVLWYRWAGWRGATNGVNRPAQLTSRSGVVVHYRRNRGDLQGIREIFIDEIYRLPDGAQVGALLDLGANIGLASIWLASEYRITEVLAVEPVAENAALLRRNLAANHLSAQVVEAAVGPVAGTAFFDTGPGSNMGHLSSRGIEVPVAAASELVGRLQQRPVLCKMDIEGAEAPLVDANALGWLADVAMLVCELHPPLVDPAEVEATLANAGFRYFPPIEQTSGHQRSKRERLFVREPTTLRR